jgi:Na+/melibiose symporter-like transporter
LPSDFTLILPGVSIIAFATGTFFWAVVSRRIGKKRSFIYGIAGYGVIMSILPILKICGLFFSGDSPLYFPAILAVSMVGYFIQSSYGVMSGAILPDVIDDYFRQTGRRMAGIISGFLFVIITVTAAGSQLLAGVVLTLIGLQPKALPGDVAIDVSDKLGLVVAGVIAVTTLAFCVVFQRYPIVDKISRR